MDIYLTDLETNSRFRFPMLPETISVYASASFYTYQIMNLGEVKLPLGENLKSFSWDGKFPGKARQKKPFLKEWSDPKEIQCKFDYYRANKRKLRLLITETPVNLNVYISSFKINYSGGYGDYDYSIQLVQAKDLKIPVSKNLSASSVSNTAASSVSSPARTSGPSPMSYTVKKGDCLWAIAEKYLGSGSKYNQLYEANKDVIREWAAKYHSSEKYIIYAGQVLTISV